MFADNEFANGLRSAIGSGNNESSAGWINFNYYYEYLDLPSGKVGGYLKIIEIECGDPRMLWVFNYYSISYRINFTFLI